MTESVLKHAESCPIGTASSEGICTCGAAQAVSRSEPPVWPGAGADERDYSLETP